MSMAKGISPDSLKIAKIIPKFKSGDVDKFSNYSLLSIMTNFSKSFEKVMPNAFLNLLKNSRYCILSLQFGFRIE